MAVREIVLFPDPILRRPTREVERFDEVLAALANDLADTMYAAPGVGLAAPQIGVDLRVAVVDAAPGTPESKLQVLVNPRIVEARGRQSADEGCLSIPGLTESVERPEVVRIAARALDGAPLELEATGLPARIYCHEIDHLDGVLFVDRLTGLRRELALRRLRKLPFVREAAV